LRKLGLSHCHPQRHPGSPIHSLDFLWTSDADWHSCNVIVKEPSSARTAQQLSNKVFSNAEIACLAAPRPMLLISDGADWTKNTERVEYPFAKHVYALYSKSENIENTHFQDEKHDYGPNKRQAAYKFLAKHLNLNINKLTNKEGLVDESNVKILDRNELTYFTEVELNALKKNSEIQVSMEALLSIKK
jgi:hypothetical protein